MSERLKEEKGETVARSFLWAQQIRHLGDRPSCSPRGRFIARRSPVISSSLESMEAAAADAISGTATSLLMTPSSDEGSGTSECRDREANDEPTVVDSTATDDTASSAPRSRTPSSEDSDRNSADGSGSYSGQRTPTAHSEDSNRHSAETADHNGSDSTPRSFTPKSEDIERSSGSGSDSGSRSPTQHSEGGNRSTAVDNGDCSVGVASSVIRDDGRDEELDSWTCWYLRKDLEWRRRARQQLEARKAARSAECAAAKHKANQRLQAERAFAAWCTLKDRQEALRRAEQRSQRAEEEAERERKDRRTCELSGRKCKEWLAKKKLEQEASQARKQQSAATEDRYQKTQENQRAYSAWLLAKRTVPQKERFHIKCIDGQLFILWE